MECKDSKLLQAALDFQNSPADPDINDIKDFFIAGAEWMAEQGVSIDANVTKYDNGLGLVMSEEDVLSGNFKLNDKVIVQIRKKDE